jgi:hypothetical protein
MMYIRCRILGLKEREVTLHERHHVDVISHRVLTGPSHRQLS